MRSFFAVLGLLAASAVLCLGAPDFSRPKYFLGFTDSSARMEFWREVATIPAGPGLSLPLRLRFTAGPGAARSTFGRAWECPLLESTLVAESERGLVWKTLGGRTVTLWRNKEGNFVSDNGSVSARRISPAELILSADGAEYRYIDGRIKGLKLASGPEVEWVYQGSRILGISSPTEGSLLSLEYLGGDALPAAIVANKKKFELKYQKVPIVTVVGQAPVVAGFEDSLQEVSYFDGKRENFPVRLETSGDYVMDFSSNAEGARTFTWAPETGVLKSDGEWTYTVKTAPEKQPMVVRTDKSGQVESYTTDSKTGTTVHSQPDGTVVTRSYFVAAGPTQSKIRKVTHTKDGVEIASRHWSYDDMGRLVRDRQGTFERNWTWSPEGKLTGQSELVGDKVLSSVKFDEVGRPVEKTLRDKTYKYSYEAGKKVVQRIQNGQVLDTRVIDAATGSIAFFRPDEKSGSLQGGITNVLNAVSPKEFEQARMLAERSLQILQNEKSE